MANAPVQNDRYSSLIYRIQNELKSRILNGDIRPGDKLPSEPELAQELGVSRNSLREAIGLLQKEGLLLKRHGVGNFVTEWRPIVRGGIEKLTGITEFIKAQGLKAESKITCFKVSRCEDDICERLDINIGDEVLLLETTKYASEVPVALCMDIIPKALVEDFDPSKIHNSVFEGLRVHYGIDIRYAECDLIPMLSDGELSEKLDVPVSTPLLLLEQLHYDFQSRRVLYSRSYFPSGRFTFKLIRRC